MSLCYLNTCICCIYFYMIATIYIYIYISLSLSIYTYIFVCLCICVQASISALREISHHNKIRGCMLSILSTSWEDPKPRFPVAMPTLQGRISQPKKFCNLAGLSSTSGRSVAPKQLNYGGEALAAQAEGAVLCLAYVHDPDFPHLDLLQKLCTIL